MTGVFVLKKYNLFRSTSIVSLMTFVSRMVGFVRDMIIAQLFGAHAGMDAFFVAFRIPNFMRRLFAEGAFSQAFVPVLAEYQKTRTDEEVYTFLSRIAGGLGSVLSVLTVVGILASPLIIFIFAPGFSTDPTRFSLAYEMLRWTFPYLMLISLTAMAGAVLNTYGYFAVPAFTPVLLNITMIMAAVYLSPYFSSPPMALAIGVLAAGVVQFLFQLPFLKHRHLLVKPTIVFSDPGVRRVLKLMVPALFGVSVAQVNLMVDTIFASFLPVGSVTWLFYTDRLADFPLGVFGVAIATVILPHLSRHHATQKHGPFSQSLDWGLRLLLLIGVPSMVGLICFSMPLIASCFSYGKFLTFDMLQTQKSLITLSIGVPAFMLVKVLASAFYAKQDIKTPVKVGVLAMVINTLLCATFIWFLAHAGLTLASALAGYVNAGTLLFLLIRRDLFRPMAGWGRFLLQLLVANGVMAVYLMFVKGDVSFWMEKAMAYRIGLLLLHVAIAILIYLLVLRCVGVRWSVFKREIEED